MKTKLSKFFLGFALVLFGLAIGAGANYLDMRQFETRMDDFVSSASPLKVSGVYQSLKANDEFSRKNFSSEVATDLRRDFSIMEHETRSQFRDIRDSVSKKKSDALRQAGTFLFLASLSLVNFVALRKSENKQGNLARAAT